VWNKIDLLDEDHRARLLEDDAARKRPPVAISAITGEGLDTLMETIEAHVSGELSPLTVTLTPAQLGLIDWLYRNGDVTRRTDNEDGSVTLTLLATQNAREEIESRLRGRA